MRRLNAKQKKLLKNYFIQNDSIEVDYQTYAQVVKLNDFETINQHMEHYLRELQASN